MTVSVNYREILYNPQNDTVGGSQVLCACHGSHHKIIKAIASDYIKSIYKNKGRYNNIVPLVKTAVIVVITCRKIAIATTHHVLAVVLCAVPFKFWTVSAAGCNYYTLNGWTESHQVFAANLLLRSERSMQLTLTRSRWL